MYDKPERQADIAYLADYLATVFSNQRVLEIACGTGYWTQYLAQTAQSVLATDISPEVLEVAKAKDFPRQNVIFKLVDFYALPKPDQRFDAGFGGFIWSHIPLSQLSDFLLSFHQRVRKDGKVVFIDNCYVAGSSTLLSTKDKEGNTFQRRKLESGEEHLVLKNFPSEKDLRQTLEGIASDVQLTLLTYYWVLTYRPIAIC